MTTRLRVNQVDAREIEAAITEKGWADVERAVKLLTKAKRLVDKAVPLVEVPFDVLQERVAAGKFHDDEVSEALFDSAYGVATDLAFAIHTRLEKVAH